MSDNERIGAKLAEMGAEVRRVVTPTPAGAVRHRAEHQQRVRRTATATLAAAAVLAIAVGAISVVRGSTAPPAPPATTQTPSPSPTPKPTQWPQRKVTDPIGATDWTRATITLPQQDGCPAGRIRFWPGDGFSPDGARSSGWPQAQLFDSDVAYGDLTGDGRPEAIMWGQCVQGAEDSGDGAGRLLVVTRDGDRLRALGWVGPLGSLFAEYWVDDGVLYTDVHPWHDLWKYTLGAAKAYRWTGTAFAPANAARYPGLEPDVPVDLTPVSGRTGCPTPVLRFGPDGRASADGVIFDLEQPQAPDGLPHLVDLEGDGTRRLLVTITCGRRPDDGIGTTALVVLERQDGGGFLALDAIRLPDGTSLADWSYSRGELTIDVDGQMRKYIWNGDRFQG
jgi:hypothetical protein